jgi:ribonucleoside-diphosphate reductase alpha chain
MPREHEAIGHRFSIAGHEGQITAGKYENGDVGEVSVGEANSFAPPMQGMLNAFGTAISIALQYGVPLEVLVRSFVKLRFEPEGITGNSEIPFAMSIPDYTMRWLASRFIEDPEILEELGIMTPEIRAKREAELGIPSARSSKR